MPAAAPDPAPDGDRWLSDPVECGRAAGLGVFVAVAPPGVDPATAHAYRRALRLDLRRAVGEDQPPVTSVFAAAGGAAGTAPGLVAGLLTDLRRGPGLAPGAEVTVETTPAAARRAPVGRLVRAGVTRLSLAVDDPPPADLAGVVAEVRDAGIARVNLELTAAADDRRPGALEAAAAARPDHVSVSTGGVDGPGGGQRRALEAAAERLREAGYQRYELTSFARGPDARGAHNLLYWRHGQYLGVGLGAHSHLGGRRWWAHGDPGDWLAAVRAGRAPVAGRESPSVAEQATERLLLGLRLADGLHPGDVPPVDEDARRGLVADGLLAGSGERLRATADGWWLLDEVVTRLAAER